jgi:signal transduction histidine kinase
MRRWVPSLRVRLTSGATLLAAAAFAVGGLVVLTIYHGNLVADRQAAARASAVAVASAATQQHLPRPIPMPVGVEVPRVQVLGTDNQVLTGDPASAAGPPMLVPADRHHSQHLTVADPWFLPARRAYLVTMPVVTPRGVLTVEAAVSLDPADAEATRAARQTALALAGSLVVVAALAWLVIGRALAPVERMRTRVAAITAGGALTQRLPAPVGRDEIGRLGQTLNEMLRALHDSDLRQRQFVADAAHELRTPLAGITAFLEVAVRHPDAITREELAGQLLAAHQRLGDLVDDLLTLASLDAHAPVRPRPVDLAAVIRDCVHDVRAAAVPVHTRIAGPVVVLGNESQLQRVITNLLDNATRYARSAVQLTLSTSERSAVMTVVDDGPGIPTDKQDQIWQRFVRLDEDRGRAAGGAGLGRAAGGAGLGRAAGGAGLGLALVREIVAAHGGATEVADAAGGPGALFTVRIPLAGNGPADPPLPA